MSVIAGLIGALGSSDSSGGGSKSAALTGTYFEPVNEGQQQTIEITFTNWDGSSPYWMLVDGAGSALTSQFDSYWGQLSPGNGNSVQTIHFTPNSDQLTEGSLNYYVRLGASYGTSEYFSEGPKAVRDSSQTPTLVLDVDPADILTPVNPLQGWGDNSGQNNNLYVINGSKSANNGGTLVFNGSTTYVNDGLSNNLSNATYGTITLSAWIKPTVINDRTQTIIAKELCYKLRLNTNGTLTMQTAKGYSPWEVTATVGAGTVVGGQWTHVVATVDASYTRIYVNGVKVTETSGNIIGANGNAFNIGAYNNAGDLFYGSMGQIKIWNYAITDSAVVTEYNGTASRYGLTPRPVSLNFVGSGVTYLLVSNTQSDWNVGNTYTIEFWSKSASASTGTGRAVVSQGYDFNSIDAGFAYGHLLWRGHEPIWPEPTPGLWTHVAFVGEGDGNTKLYYNGVYQTYFTSDLLSNNSTDLAIGRRGPTNDQQYFYGNLAMLRISNAAKYTASFTPTTTYGVESDTKLLLGKNNPFVDANSVHPIGNNNVLASTDFPNILSGIHNAFDGGTAGNAYTLSTNPNYAVFSQIPVGATIFSNLWSGARTVLSSQIRAGAGPGGIDIWEVHYDGTGLGFTSTSDTYTFVW